MSKLTRRQRDCLIAVSEITESCGFPPSLNEIACHMGIVSRGTACVHVRKLVGEGFLIQGTGHRTIRLTEKGRAALGAEA